MHWYIQIQHIFFSSKSPKFYKFWYIVFLIFLHSLLLCLFVVTALHLKSHNRYKETLESPLLKVFNLL